MLVTAGITRVAAATATAQFPRYLYVIHLQMCTVTGETHVRRSYLTAYYFSRIYLEQLQAYTTTISRDWSLSGVG